MLDNLLDRIIHNYFLTFLCHPIFLEEIHHQYAYLAIKGLSNH